MKDQISPSLMCVDFGHINETLQCFARQNVEYLHVDVMDGHFVPNYALGVDFVKYLRTVSSIPADVHLMVENPEQVLDWFAFQPGEYVSVHAESTRHICRALQKIRALGAKSMVAINPGTPLTALDEVLDLVDGVLLMTVNPGFAGQKLVPSTVDKIRRLRRKLDESGHADVEIEVDGNVSFENAEIFRAAGANIFVAGTSSVFKKDLTPEQGLQQLRSSIASGKLRADKKVSHE